MAEKTANFGFIGISGRGSGMLREFLSAPGVKVTAVCDKYEDRARHGAEIVKEVTGEDGKTTMVLESLIPGGLLGASIIALFMALPAYYSVIQSLKPIEELFAYPPKFFVRKPRVIE